MTDTKIAALTSLAAQPASNDLLVIVDVSDTAQAASGSTRKIAAAYFAQTQGSVVTITGGGTIALGGFTLTVPATGTVALLATANTFTTQQTVSPSSTGVDGLIVNVPSSTAGYTQKWQYNSTVRANMLLQSTVSLLEMNSYDAGNGAIAPQVRIGRNSNASAPAAGSLAVAARDGTVCFIWVDNSGNVRLSTASAPTNSTDTSGVVIGTQTSMAAAKNISEALPDPTDALLGVWRAAKSGLRAWSYKSGGYNGEFFPNGIVTDLAPRYGMDRDAEHPAGKSLNIPVAIGDLMAAVAVIMEKLGIQKEEDLLIWLQN